MQRTLKEQVERGKELLRTIRHAAMATVNADGTPHNTPFMFMHDGTLEHIFWGSHPDSEHSKNVLRTGEVFVVLYDAFQKGGGLYIKATDGHQLAGDELAGALTVHNALRVSRGQDPLPLTYYTGDSPQRMWSARIEQIWVNASVRDENGLIIRDARTEISAGDLL
jgi:hypothetical protein